ncbi:hypothetical protein GCM10010377_57230 [Streptomyces viridiviolaceus]|nr:hypothetical protein GCM10010377_57230 [Streptomyces viridiviolaceus]
MLMSSAGAACTDMDRPVAAADPVIWRTSRFCTVSCIHVPAFDTKFATDHHRMLRYLRDRQGECDAAIAGAGSDGGAGAGGAEGEEDTVRCSKTTRGPARGGRTGARTPAALRGHSTEPEYGADHRGRRDRRVGAGARCRDVRTAAESPCWPGTLRHECG